MVSGSTRAERRELAERTAEQRQAAVVRAKKVAEKAEIRKKLIAARELEEQAEKKWSLEKSVERSRRLKEAKERKRREAILAEARDNLIRIALLDADQVAQVRPDGPEVLIGYYEAVVVTDAELLAELTATDLDRVVDERWDPPVTLGVRLVSIADDDIQHAGQAAYLRGILDR